MRLSVTLIVLLALASLAGGCDRCATPEPSKEFSVVMGFTPAENAENVETNGEMMAQALARRTGFPFKVYVASSYAAVIEALAHDQIDFAWLPPFSLIQAEKLCQAQPLLKIVRHGNDSYFGGVIVRKDSGITAVTQLKGMSIAWADVVSTSGHIFPKAKMMGMGIDPETFFKRQLYAGGHDKVVIAVLSGQVEAGATWVNRADCLDGSWNRYFAERSGEITCIMATDPIPNDVIATTGPYRRAHPREVKTVEDALVAMTADPKESALLQNLYGIEGLTPAKSADFEVVRQAARYTDVWQQ